MKNIYKVQPNSDFLKSPIEYLKGVGPAKGEFLRQELGLHTFEDLLHDFPFRYIDKTEFHTVRDTRQSGLEAVQIIGRFTHIEVVKAGNRKRLTAQFEDKTGSIEVIWFQGISWLVDFIQLNIPYVLYGKPNAFKGKVNLAHPEIELYDPTKKQPSQLVPVYASTEKLDARKLDSKGRRKAVAYLMAQLKPHHLPESLPQEIIQQLRLDDRYTTIQNIHFPPDQEALQRAINRIKFEELFFLQLNLLRNKIRRVQDIKGHIFKEVGSHFLAFYNDHLGFELTGAQKRVIKEIRQDVGSGKHMNRLLQGDVGSGKTIVAVMSCLLAIDNGFQACVMAPTEILAQQHFTSFSDNLNGLEVRVAFLSGSIKGKERKQLLADLAEGLIDILIGTHALIEDPVIFKNIGLAVIDEQHRFGVEQRAKLWRKGIGAPPHVLVMTATPIPRTLAMTLYGDLDVSVIDELPPGRRLIKTVHRREANRMQVIKFMKAQIAEGRQIYVVFPLIEESETLDLQNLQTGYDELLSYFPKPEYQISVVHGKMKHKDKDYEMQRFVAKKSQILVSTTVIEVGVDVPNATVMIIENAERFGLSQMHQLRGRVGRGGNQSYCILMTSYKVSAQGKERIDIMINSHSGFDIAEADLRLRGPGEIIGTRQSGSFNFKLANLAQDGRILSMARHLAERIIQDDPNLENEKHAPIRNYIIHSKKYRKDWSRIS